LAVQAQRPFVALELVVLDSETALHFDFLARRLMASPSANLAHDAIAKFARRAIILIDASCAPCNTVAMKLKDYLAQPGKTATDLAAKCCVNVSTITRAANGDTNPTLPLMRQIAQHTGGKVALNDWSAA
jgi:DNA-binding XRE family transcriptional regulator